MVFCLVYICTYIMLDTRKNRDYTKRILKICKEKEPELFKHITEQQVLTVLNYVTKNICLSMLKRFDIYINNFMSIFFDKNIAGLKQLRKKNYEDKLKNQREIQKILDETG